MAAGRPALTATPTESRVGQINVFCFMEYVIAAHQTYVDAVAAPVVPHCICACSPSICFAQGREDWQLLYRTLRGGRTSCLQLAADSTKSVSQSLSSIDAGPLSRTHKVSSPGRQPESLSRGSIMHRIFCSRRHRYPCRPSQDRPFNHCQHCRYSSLPICRARPEDVLRFESRG